jgi:hypothetical protein
MPSKSPFDTGAAVHGRFTLAGGSATEAETLAGARVGDTIICCVRTNTNASQIEKVVITDDTVTFTFNTGPGASTVDYLWIKKGV